MESSLPFPTLSLITYLQNYFVSVKLFLVLWSLGFPGGAGGKEPAPRDMRDVGSVPGLRRSSGGGHGPSRSSIWHNTPVFCLENLTGRGAWWATVHRIAKSQARTEATWHACLWSRYFLLPLGSTLIFNPLSCICLTERDSPPPQSLPLPDR